MSVTDLGRIVGVLEQLPDGEQFAFVEGMRTSADACLTTAEEPRLTADQKTILEGMAAGLHRTAARLAEHLSFDSAG